MVQEVGTAGVEAQVAELLDEQQVEGDPDGEVALQRVLGLAGDEVVDKVGGGVEADSVAAQPRELADGVGQVGLADAGGTDEDAVRLIGDEVERGGAQDEVAVDGLGVVEVVGIERGGRENGRAPEGELVASLGVDAQLLAHQDVEQRRGRVVAGDGFAGGLVEERGGVVAAQRPARPTLTLDDVRDMLLVRDQPALVYLIVALAAEQDRLREHLLLEVAGARAGRRGAAPDVRRSLRAALDRATETRGVVENRCAADFAGGIDQVVDAIDGLMGKGSFVASR